MYEFVKRPWIQVYSAHQLLDINAKKEKTT